MNPQFAQCLFQNLPYPFSAEGKPIPDFFQGELVTIPDSEAEPDNFSLPQGQIRQDEIDAPGYVR